MAEEARAMLDALMGSDRDAAPKSAGRTNSKGDGSQDWDSLRTKKSCYDRDICPLYCAWGVDVFELFTNTKSDLGPNPCVVQEDARDEYLSLPDHEKDRLGFERMLWNKLGEEVRKCDRIVMRNKEKLRQEIAKAARARSNGKTTIDPATDVSEEMILDAANIMADLELREEEVADMIQKIMSLDNEWTGLWKELQDLLKEELQVQELTETEEGKEIPAISTHLNATDGADQPQAEGTPTDANESGKDDNNVENNDSLLQPEKQTQNDIPNSSDKDAKIKSIKKRLYAISSEEQKTIGSLASVTTQKIVPLRDSLQSLTKQLHYVKTDMSSDKTVCEVSGNFMSSRDAEERIAAHYAGKQYVGWKMVRDKFKDLDKKMRNMNQRNGYGPMVHDRGGPPRHDGYRDGRGGHGRQERGGGQRWDHGGHDRRRERSRSRDRYDHGSRDGGGGHNRQRDRRHRGRW